MGRGGLVQCNHIVWISKKKEFKELLRHRGVLRQQKGASWTQRATGRKRKLKVDQPRKNGIKNLSVGTFFTFFEKRISDDVETFILGN